MEQRRQRIAAQCEKYRNKSTTTISLHKGWNQLMLSKVVLLES
jgi:hypothetical protein